MPIHPAIVHFPIAFYFLELFLLFLWIARREPAYRRFAFFSFRLGYLTMLLAMGAGLLDAKGIQGVTGRVRTHAYAAVCVFVLYTLRAVLWRFAGERRFSKWIHLLGAVVGSLSVVLTGFLGGRLVY